ncbi:hypothetical protein EGH21_22460 [Halomicroarcula sp. F13]|uniref:Uncharacterized protein n=1 Tax=Haloarcula rubra TaxID=2487747 RepID=A0AAW4Q0I8_9EURY|nr:hypothetical protein [Halomicroarcula rubra]MBX0325784.1 hypothetical protein [Halomicroarcula rubra]
MATDTDRVDARFDHQHTRDLGWYLFTLLPSGLDDCVADHMVAEGVYGRPRYVGGPLDAE